MPARETNLLKIQYSRFKFCGAAPFYSGTGTCKWWGKIQLQLQSPWLHNTVFTDPHWLPFDWPPGSGSTKHCIFPRIGRIRRLVTFKVIQGLVELRMVVRRLVVWGMVIRRLVIWRKVLWRLFFQRMVSVMGKTSEISTPLILAVFP
jgi:hypothetical protein